MPERPGYSKNQYDTKVHRAFDMSKWDNIDISDDEKTFHPNIENNFNVKINRTVRDRKDQEDAEKIEKLQKEGTPEAMREIEKMERNKKWHVGNICHTAHERTIINEYSEEDKKPMQMPQEENEEHLKGFHEWKDKHKDILEAFIAAGGNQTTSQKILKEHGALLLSTGETKNYAMTYCMLECLEAFVQDKEAYAKKCAHQSQMLQHIIELAGTFHRPPRDLVVRWFEKIGQKEQAKDVYEADVKTFLEKVKVMAAEKKERLAKEAEEEAAAAAEEAKKAEEAGTKWVMKNKYGQDDPDVEIDESQEPQPLIKVMHQIPKEQRLACAPGGLDPVEVFESLPKVMQEAFESQDVQRLVGLQKELPIDVFGYHMSRCVKAGLWQQPNDDGEDDGDEDEGEAMAEDGNAADEDMCVELEGIQLEDKAKDKK